MIVLYFADYADYKQQVQTLLGTAASQKTFVRDGTANNTGFEALAIETAAQNGAFALRFGAMQKPASFDTDFSKKILVTSITVV
jgi:hypothetical protein